MQSTPPVVLGSGSPYRRALLARLLQHFEVVVPAVAEERRSGEDAAALAARLALAKATAVASMRPGAVVIGSDQVAECEGEIMTKPGTAERALLQLGRCSGRELILHTAVCVLPADGGAGETHVDRTVLRFRSLSSAEISRYVERDQPLDCAGSFRFESLGAALFTDVQTADPTAIEGLPLLWLAGALMRAGVPVI
jgi:septum formation protein